MADVGVPQLFDSNSHHTSTSLSFQPHNFSSLDLFQKQNSFGFSPGTSPAPNDIKDEGSDSFFDLPGRYMAVPHSSSLAPKDFGYRFSTKDDLYQSASPQLTQQPSRLRIPSATTRQVHGQLTPPSETTPTNDSLPAETPRELESSPVEIQTSSSPRKRRRTQASQASETPSQPATTPRRRKKSIRKQPSTESAANGDDKRNQFLERNRVAASKCRQKKKEWTSNLEKRARELQASKTSLALLVSSLREELLYLKGEALRHTTCDCNSVREYLGRHAEASLPCNRLEYAQSPHSGSNFSFEVMDLDPAIILDSPSSFAMAENQDLPELNTLGQIPD
jgi:bZIP transcription factor